MIDEAAHSDNFRSISAIFDESASTRDLFGRIWPASHHPNNACYCTGKAQNGHAASRCEKFIVR